MDERRAIVDFFQKQGILIQPDAVEFLINSEEEKNSLVRRAYDRVKKKFSVEVMTAAYFNILFKNEI